MNKKVSIIVPCFNSIKCIDIFINSVVQQTYKNIEVVAVNDGSTDGTGGYLDRHQSSLSLKVVHNPGNKGMTYSRNIGIEHTTGDYIWFLDSDMELPPEAVERCVSTCENEGYDALMIPERSKGTSFWALCRGFEKRINDDDLNKNACRFMKREVIEAVGNYDENLTAAEDFDYHMRVNEKGFKYKLIKSTFLYHYEVASSFQMLRKAFNYGKTMPAYIKKRPQESFNQFFIIRPAYLKNYKMFLREPIAGLGLLFIKILQYTSASFGMAYWLLKR